MSAPNQPYPAWMQATGLGAYAIDGSGGGAGGSTGYGQDITQAQINTLIQGPATALTNLDAVTALSDVVTIVENYLKTQPLQALQLFQGFLPGKTSADFTDVPTAINTIISALGLGNLSSTSADLTRVGQDLLVLFDLLHLTYNPGSPSDPPGTLGVGGVGPGKPTWYSAWNDFLAYITKITGISFTTPTSTVGPAVYLAQATATTAGTNASIAIASNQATNDAIVTATTGSPVTGTSTTDVTTGLSNIPATNVVGGAGAAVTYGAGGSGNVTTTPASPQTVSETHTIAAGDLGVLAFISYEALSSTTVTSAVTYGGTAMTLLYSLKSSAYSSNASWLEVWWLKAPPSGAKTVTATATPASGSAGLLSLQTESYAASKIGTVSPASGGGSTSLSMSASSATGNMVAAAFHAVKLSAAVTLSAFSQTQLYNWSGGPGWANVIGDAAGAGTVAFAATASTATTAWIGITVELKN